MIYKLQIHDEFLNKTLQFFLFLVPSSYIFSECIFLKY